MKRSLCIAAMVVAGLAGVLAAAAPAAAQDDMLGSLLTMEKSLWQGWAEGDQAPFAAHLTDDAVMITPGGMTAGKAAALEMLVNEKCEVESWELSSPAVHQVTDDVVILTYEADQAATCGGQDASGHLQAASVWVKQGDQWMAASHQETMMPPADMEGMEKEQE